MKEKIISYIKNNLGLLLCFLIPLTIMALYAAYRNMAPFGNSSILTVDLGQQYIDFFSFFRKAVLQHPSSILYSFSNGLGNEMIGNWAYYLGSPLNIILLFFSSEHLSSAILLLILIKIGLSGMSFGWMTKKFNLTDSKVIVIAFSTAYALNGWMVANNLNVIWLDAMILLPIIITGLQRLLKENKKALFIISYSAMLIINFYMAYMITIFIVGCAVVYVVINSSNLRQYINYGIHLLVGIVSSILISAFLLLPALLSMLSTKIKSNTTIIKPVFEYFVPNIITKFFPGAFNFNQMPKGLPNIFVTSIILLLFLLFFINKSFSRKTRLTVFLFSTFLLLSLCFEPLDLFWQAFQFPVWYPYRFSFVVCFWMILIGLISFTKIKTISWKQKDLWFIILILVIGDGYVAVEKNSFNYLTTYTVIIGILLTLIALIILLTELRFEKSFNWFVGIFIIAEVIINLYFSLNGIAYLSNSQYEKATNINNELISYLNKYNQNKFYRVSKDYSRTKDDPFNANYNGASLFSSVTNPKMSNFIGEIGEPNASGEVDYPNSNVINDSLLNMQYHIARPIKMTSNSLKPSPINYDQSSYKKVKSLNGFTIFKNATALPILFNANQSSLEDLHKTQDPIQNNANLWASLTGKSQLRTDLLTVQNFNNVKYKNLPTHNVITGTQFNRRNILDPASLTFTIKPTTNDSYYLTLGNSLTSDTCDISIDGTPVNVENSNVTQIISVASNSKNKPIKIVVRLKKPSIWLQNFTLYKLNNPLFTKEDHKLQKNSHNIKEINARTVSGTVNVKKNGVIATTIPNIKGWHAFVDKKSAPVTNWDNYFIAIKTTPGKHHVVFKYYPPYLNIGIIISAISILGFVIVEIRKHRK